MEHLKLIHLFLKKKIIIIISRHAVGTCSLKMSANNKCTCISHLHSIMHIMCIPNTFYSKFHFSRYYHCGTFLLDFSNMLPSVLKYIGVIFLFDSWTDTIINNILFSLQRYNTGEENKKYKKVKCMRKKSFFQQKKRRQIFQSKNFYTSPTSFF